MGDGVPMKWNGDEVLFRRCDALSDGIGNCVGLAHAYADTPFSIAHDHYGIEAEVTAPFDNLCHAGDPDNPLGHGWLFI